MASPIKRLLRGLLAGGLALALAAAPASAASSIAFDAKSIKSTSWSSGNLSWNHTNNGNVLIVCPWSYNASLATVTGITYNGSALTKIASITANLESNWQDIECWYIANPATGSNTIAVTWSTSPSFSNGAAESFSGVSTSSPIDSHATGQSTSSVNAFSQATTVVTTGGAWLVTAMFGRGGGVTLDAPPSGTLREADTGNISGSTGMADSTGMVASGSQLLRFSWPTSGTVPGAITVSLLPSTLNAQSAIDVTKHIDGIVMAPGLGAGVAVVKHVDFAILEPTPPAAGGLPLMGCCN